MKLLHSSLTPVILSLVTLLGLAVYAGASLFGQSSTHTATIEKTYCNGSTGFCTTDKTDGRLKNPDNAPTAPLPPTTDLSTGEAL